MNIELRKINFIQEFLKLNDEKTIDKLEKILKLENSKTDDQNFEPMPKEAFNAIIDRAEDDVKNNRVKNAHQLKDDIKNARGMLGHSELSVEGFISRNREDKKFER